ncbi:hypothetical protein [Argonema antarcticum]|nr:hypothetical protein [Argonema antarcticum]
MTPLSIISKMHEYGSIQTIFLYWLAPRNELKDAIALNSRYFY